MTTWYELRRDYRIILSADTNRQNVRAMLKGIIRTERQSGNTCVRRCEDVWEVYAKADRRKGRKCAYPIYILEIIPVVYPASLS